MPEMHMGTGHLIARHLIGRMDKMTQTQFQNMLTLTNYYS